MTEQQVRAVELAIYRIDEVKETSRILGQKFKQDDEPREIKEIVLGLVAYLERTGMSDQQIEKTLKRVEL